jgi:chromate reductase
MEKKKILAISGSTRKFSTNSSLIMAIAALSAEIFDITLYEGIAGLPHFIPEEVDNPGEQVAHFRKLLGEADGVIICTPEYAHGVPGTLKNAIDWTVGTSNFSHKPTALITASTDGQYGHRALLETLRVIEASNIDQLELLISHIRTKVSKENKITDEKTLSAIQRLIEDLHGVLWQDVDRL